MKEEDKATVHIQTDLWRTQFEDLRDRAQPAVGLMSRGEMAVVAAILVQPHCGVLADGLKSQMDADRLAEMVSLNGQETS